MSVKIEKRFKLNLDYLMKNKKGQIETLKNNISESRVREYESNGFINTEYKTYSATPLAKQYYKDLFGKFAYFKIVIKNFFKRQH